MTVPTCICRRRISWVLVPQARHGWTGFEEIKMSMFTTRMVWRWCGPTAKAFRCYRRADSTDPFRRLGVEDSEGDIDASETRFKQ